MIREECLAELDENIARAWLENGLASSSPALQTFGPMTAVLDLTCLPSAKARGFAENVGEFPGVVANSLLWLDEWCAATGDHVEKGDDRRLVFDVEKSRCSFSPDEIAECRKENVIEIPHEWRKGRTCAYLTVAGTFYDAIAGGRKKVECRDYNKYWARRLLGPKISEVVLQRGYVKHAPQMRFAVDKIMLEDCDGSRYQPEEEPPMSIPSLILVHLGARLDEGQ